MKLGERGVVGREGGVRAMGNYKGCSFRVVVISLSEGFRGPLIIGSIWQSGKHLKEVKSSRCRTSSCCEGRER